MNNLVGNIPSSTELVFDQVTGTLWNEWSNGGVTFDNIDLMGNILSSFDHPCCAYNGLEYVNGVLYGTNIQRGGGLSPSTLITIDPTSQTITDIGLTGLGPISGLAYDTINSILYGVTAGGSDAMLVTIDIHTGVATPLVRWKAS